MPKMPYSEKGGVRASGWRRLFLIWFPLAFLILVNAATQARSISKRGSHQEIRFEDKLEAEQRLYDLGYWTGPVDGNLDPVSRHALIAFQKVEGRQRTGKLTLQELQALRTAVRPLPRHTDYAHVEIDINRQVLFIVDAGSSITHILPVSTGNEGSYIDHGQLHRAHTPRGKFKVLRRVSGWRLSSLGLLYYPNYIHEGVAIHGSLSVPTYAASHGCIRIPMFAAKEFNSLVSVGMEVIVYDS